MDLRIFTIALLYCNSSIIICLSKTFLKLHCFGAVTAKNCSKCWWAVFYMTDCLWWQISVQVLTVCWYVLINKHCQHPMICTFRLALQTVTPPVFCSRECMFWVRKPEKELLRASDYPRLIAEPQLSARGHRHPIGAPCSHPQSPFRWLRLGTASLYKAKRSFNFTLYSNVVFIARATAPELTAFETAVGSCAR